VVTHVTTFLVLADQCPGSEGSGLLAKPGPYGQRPYSSLNHHVIKKYVTHLWHSHPCEGWGPQQHLPLWM
jgi:hypothetical protein